MNFFTTGIEAVDRMGQLQMVGNIKPAIWNETIVNEKGKPQRLAMDILADISYWYRPTEVRDENSGLVVGWKKRFASDMLQRNYAELSEQFCEEKKTIIRAVIFLEELGVIQRVFRTLKYKNGMIANNVMFIDLNVDRLYELTYPDKNTVGRTGLAENNVLNTLGEYEIIEEDSSSDTINQEKQRDDTPPYKNVGRVPTNLSTPPYKNVERVSTNLSTSLYKNVQSLPTKLSPPPYKSVETNTENTTEITTETSTSTSVSYQLDKKDSKADNDVDIDGMMEYVSQLMGYRFLYHEADDYPDEERARIIEFNSILEDVRKILVFEVFTAPDKKQFNLGTKDMPDIKTAPVLRSVFEKYLDFGKMKRYIDQYLLNSTKVKYVTMYHIKSLYRQCITQSSQNLSGKDSIYAREKIENE